MIPLDNIFKSIYHFGYSTLYPFGGRMKAITTAGNKGGIGKSTSSLTLAHYLAICKKMKGALIDLDPQGNSSSSLIPTIRDPAHPTGFMPKPHPEWDPKNLPEDDPHWDGISSIADIFTGRPIYPYPTWIENLKCFPSFASLLEDAQRVLKVDVNSIPQFFVLDEWDKIWLTIQEISRTTETAHVFA